MNRSSEYTMTVGGKAVPGLATIDVRSPATGQVVAHAPDCSRDQLDTAVSAARAAFPAWSTTPIAERRRAILAIS